MHLCVCMVWVRVWVYYVCVWCWYACIVCGCVWGIDVCGVNLCVCVCALLVCCFVWLWCVHLLVWMCLCACRGTSMEGPRQTSSSACYLYFLRHGLWLKLQLMDLQRPADNSADPSGSALTLISPHTTMTGSCHNVWLSPGLQGIQTQALVFLGSHFPNWAHRSLLLCASP